MDTNHTFFSSITLERTEVRPAGLKPRIFFYQVCIDLPPKVASDGIWANDTTGALPLQSTLTILELQIITIFTLTQGFHFLLKRLGFPYFVSQVMTGFLLGPSIPIAPLEKYKKMLFPYGSGDILSTISSLGFNFFLFTCGVQMDFTMITRTGKKAWFIALSSLLLPILLGFFFLINLSHFWIPIVGEHEAPGLEAVVISHSGNSFAVIASLLTDLGILNSELGRLALSSALVSDIGSSIVSGVGTALVSARFIGMGQAIQNLIKFFAFLVLVPLMCRPPMNWVVKHTPEGRPVKKIYTYIIIATLLVLGYIATALNQPFLAGAVVLGLAVPEGPPLGSALVEQLDLFSTWFMLPIFVTCCTMKVDLTKCHNLKLVLVVTCVIILVHLIKMLLCIGICKFCSIPTTDGFCLALILSCKGVMEICTYTLVYDALKHSDAVIGILIISVLVLGTISRISVKSLYDPSRKYAGYQKRNILNLKPNSELRVVACMHKPSHIIPIKNVLNLCSPTPGKALVVDVLHLMELVGRTSPIFISHRLQQRLGSNHQNFSGELIVAFDLFELDYAGSASVNTYTAISPLNLMHEDICYLALDKLASIIILPFHKRWTEDGTVESEDNNIRSLNSRVMERAPCSIGILVNRGNYGYHYPSNFRIATIFIGGPDDREALSLAKRSAKDSNNTLVVYHLVASDSDPTDWDHMLDHEVLRDVRGAYGSLENVSYEERHIEDASETTSLMNAIANKYDFIIVGRRNGVKSSVTDALVIWTEYSELGVIGDLLASPDTETKASILVVQQQQHRS